jgi:hypothetical protein
MKMISRGCDIFPFINHKPIEIPKLFQGGDLSKLDKIISFLPVQ